MSTEHPKPATETVLLGKKHGRDIRVFVPAGQAQIHELPQTEDSRYANFLDRISFGPQRFDNYPHDVFILDSHLFSCHTDAIGTEVCYVELFSLGDHTNNDVGQYIPQERAWNGREPETRVFARYSSHRWSPGEYSLSLLRNSTGEHIRAKKLHDRTEANPEAMRRVKTIYDRAGQYRRSVASDVADEPLTMTGD